MMIIRGIGIRVDADDYRLRVPDACTELMVAGAIVSTRWLELVNG